MYLPPAFEVCSADALHSLLDTHPFGMLVTYRDSGLEADHLPFLLERQGDGPGVLHAHVARANPVWQQVSSGAEVLVVFRAEDAYVSPNWYPSKQEAHRQVPTWNYRVVHAYGTLTVHDDERYVRGVVARLTRRHEAGLPQPWKMTDAPPDYIDDMLSRIVGLEVRITRLAGKFKLGQNRDARDREGAARALIESGHEAIGQAMMACTRDGQNG